MLKLKELCPWGMAVLLLGAPEVVAQQDTVPEEVTEETMARGYAYSSS